MGWQDRDYGPSINYGEMPHANPLLNLLFGSFPLGTWFGIRVRIHATLLWYGAFELFRAGSLGWQNVAISMVILFAIVLLHEFGHCLGARSVGGRPDNILLWPFGGLATADHPHNWWARFVTVACGPLVNVILIPAFAIPFYLITHEIPPLNPLAPWVDSVLWNYLIAHPGVARLYELPGGHWLFWAYITNYMLLAFNLLPIFPLDGGQLVQTILWKFIGYVRSMNISCIVGMIAAVPFAIWGLYQGTLFTACLGIMGFMACFQLRRATRMYAAQDESEPYDLSAAWHQPEHHSARKKTNKRWAKAARKRAQAEQAEQAQIDAILAKVKEKGLHSLTFWEKRALKRATERQRQRALAERL